MSLNDQLKKLAALKAADAKKVRQRFKRDQAFLPGVSLDTYLNATEGPQIDKSSIGSFIGSSLSALVGQLNPKTIALKGAMPKMRQAFMNQDIFAYNAVKEKLDRVGGNKTPSAPDSVMVRKEARRKADRTRVSSRASTLGLKY